MLAKRDSKEPGSIEQGTAGRAPDEQDSPSSANRRGLPVVDPGEMIAVPLLFQKCGNVLRAVAAGPGGRPVAARPCEQLGRPDDPLANRAQGQGASGPVTVEDPRPRGPLTGQPGLLNMPGDDTPQVRA